MIRIHITFVVVEWVRRTGIQVGNWGSELVWENYDFFCSPKSEVNKLDKVSGLAG